MWDAIEQLTRPHKKSIHTIDGFEVHDHPGLLAQLRDAIHGGVTTDGTRGGLRSKLPFQAAALDLYMTIELQILNAYREQYPTQVPGAEHPERFLTLWAAKVTTTTIVDAGFGEITAHDLVHEWVRMIEDYFNPPRLAEIQAPCVSCGERWQWRRIDGEDVRSSALAFRRDRDTGESLDARCLVCGVVWPPSQFEFLIRAIAEAEKAQKHADVT